MGKKKDKPEIIELSEQECSDLKRRINDNNLNDSDRTLLINVLNCMIWLQDKLTHAKISIGKLKKLLGFGSAHRSAKKAANEDNNDEPPNGGGDQNTPSTKTNAAAAEGAANKGGDNRNAQGRKNGRLSSASYPDKNIVWVQHESVKPGAHCASHCGGRLYATSAGTVLRIQGQSSAIVVEYQLEKLRCNLCGEILTATLPIDAGTEKYDAKFKSQCVLQKYYLGIAFYANEQYHRALGFPLSDATQWSLVEDVANCAYPILSALEQLMMQGELVHYDDTGVKILSHIKEVAANPKLKRRGTFTTAVVGRYEDKPIYLYYSSKRHAGENMSRLLEKRSSELSAIKTMSDALGANKISQFDVIAAHCLGHGLRKFRDIEKHFVDECGVVLKALRKVYVHDEETKSLSAQERLAYHQKHSAPVMTTLKKYLEQQLAEKRVEPNSHLGQAINYLLNHWQGLTQFLRVARAPLDNNICEQALKLAIKVRKMAMFHKTEHGAYVAGLLQSLIQTAIKNQVNPCDYLTALQQHKHDVFKDPTLWLPWNYTEQIIKPSVESLELKAA